MATTDSLPVPKKNADFRLRVFIEDASGDPASSFTNANSTISQDDTSFVDCTNEVAFVGNGYGYIDLTSSEMNCDGLVYRFECDEGSFQVEICPEEAGDIRVNATQLGGTNYATAVTALVASFWNALTSGITTNGSIGKLIVDNLNAAVGTVSTNVSTLLTRLTSTRAGYLDKLNITGNVASQASVDDIPTNSEFAAALPANFGLMAISEDGVIKSDVVQWQEESVPGLDAGWVRVHVETVENDAIKGTSIDSTAVTRLQSGLATSAHVTNELSPIKGATFDTSTDSLEALRNRGDAAWVTGGASAAEVAAAVAALEGQDPTSIPAPTASWMRKLDYLFNKLTKTRWGNKTQTNINNAAGTQIAKVAISRNRTTGTLTIEADEAP